MVTNPAVQQVVFNIALFVPLGAYLRRRAALRAAVGFRGTRCTSGANRTESFGDVVTGIRCLLDGNPVAP